MNSISNVLARDVPAQANQVARHVGHVDLVTHVQHVDDTRIRLGRGVQHKLHGLGDQHEEPLDVRVCHGHGPASSDLLEKSGHDAAVGAEHVSESDRTERGRTCIRKILDAQFADTFRGTHHAGWIDGLVCGYVDESLDQGAQRLFRHGSRAQDVVLHALRRIHFDHGHVLVCRGVKNDLRSEFLEHGPDARPVGDVGEIWTNVHVSQAIAKLDMDRV